MTQIEIYKAALEEIRQEAAMCRDGNRLIMVKTVEKWLRRTDAALAAAEAATKPGHPCGAMAWNGDRCSLENDGHDFHQGATSNWPAKR